uniref:Putative insect pheromone-binding family n=1 Tax=Rhodnius prolixus TaxID=13249 RepID=R4FKV6_RHOPR
MTCKVVMLAALVACSLAADRYNTKYDHLDLDQILNNERIYKKYLECLIRRGKCTPDARDLRDALPDALQNECTKCTLKQKLGSEKVIKFLLKKKPNDFHLLEKTYDPNGEYRKNMVN